MSDDVIGCSEIDGAVFDALDKSKRQPVEAVPTPFPTWNRMCRDEGGGQGLAKGWNVIVAADTGGGKSVLGLNMAAHAFKQGVKVCYVSLEMSDTQLITRTMSIFSGISIRRLEHGSDYSPADAHTVKLNWAGQRERTGGAIWLNNDPVSNLNDLMNMIQDMVTVHDCRLVIVDYVQLVWTGSARTMLDRIIEVSAMIRRQAKQLGHTVVALSQFNRETFKMDRAPTKHDLMGGSPLENDADQVVLVDHTSKEDSGDKVCYDLLLDKNRHGEQGKIPVVFDKGTLRITEEGR